MKKEKNYNRRSDKDYNIFRATYYMLFVILVVLPVTKFMYNIKIEGRENIPKTSRLIFTGNHVSYIDPPLISLAAWRTIAYMAKQELFYDKNKLLRFLVHTLGGFAVNREKPELATFKTVKDIFKTNWSLGIFPQGKIIKEPVIKNIHKGFILFAKKFQADIVPVAICGFDGYATKLFQKHITLKVGKPISYQLNEDEILRLWAKHICDSTGFENEIEDQLKEQATV